MPSSSSSPGDVARLRSLAAAELHILEPLWLSLQAHHLSLDVVQRPPRSASRSWELRRGQYERWLAKADSFVVVAELHGRPVGYAFVHIDDPSATWNTPRVACLETLAILNDTRGKGIGTRLLGQVEHELRQRGIKDLEVSVVAGNVRADRFLARNGFTTLAWTRTIRLT